MTEGWFWEGLLPYEVSGTAGTRVGPLCDWEGGGVTGSDDDEDDNGPGGGQRPNLLRRKGVDPLSNVGDGARTGDATRTGAQL